MRRESVTSAESTEYRHQLRKNNLLIHRYLLAPLNISQSLNDISVLLGQSGTLQIVCDAFPAPKVTWSVHTITISIRFNTSLLLGSSTMSS